MRFSACWKFTPVLLITLANMMVGCRNEPLSSAVPGSLAASISLDPAEIRVGDLARLLVIVEHPSGGNLELPALGKGKAVLVRDLQRKTVALQRSRERTTFNLRLTSYELGEHRVGAGMITFRVQGGKVLEMSFPDATLRTRTVLQGEDTPLRDIKGLTRWPAPVLRWAGLTLVLLLSVAALFLGMRWWRTRPRETSVVSPPAASPHETALNALATLRGRKLTRVDQVEPFYRDLSAIVRRYAEDRFGLRAPEQTTEELMMGAAVSGLLLPIHQKLFHAFLEQCDLVKFAKHRPGADDMSRAFTAAERLVRETSQIAREEAGS